MIKLKNSVFNPLQSAKSDINCIETEDAIKIHSDIINMFINVRDIREIKKSDRILGAKHVPRGMLEFWIDPNSPYHKKNFNENLYFIFSCGSDCRSALAIFAANNIGLLNTFHLIGSFNRWNELNSPIEIAR